MNGVGLITVGRLLGHRKRRTTAIYAHLDDATRQDAAAQVAAVIAGAMGYRTAPPPLPDEADGDGDGATPDTPPGRGCESRTATAARQHGAADQQLTDCAHSRSGHSRVSPLARGYPASRPPAMLSDIRTADWRSESFARCA